MFRVGLLACLLGLAVLVISCGGDRPVNSTTDLPDNLSPKNPIVLHFGETAILTPLNLEVTFESVPLDCRCPIGVYCFWEGIAEIRVRVVELPADTHLVTISIYGGDPCITYPFLLPVDTLGCRFTLLSLDPYPVYDDPIPDSAYIATLSIFPYPPIDSVDGEVKITDLPPTSIQVDFFNLDTVYVNGDVINLTVSHSGGCREHEFGLYMSPAAFFESYPAQTNLYLRHDADDDMCKAYITEHLSFDLRPIAHLYELMYGHADPIRLNMYYFFDSIPGEKQSVVYYPEDYWNNDRCD